MIKKYVDMHSNCRNCLHERQFHLMYQPIMEGYNLSKYVVPLEYVPCVSTSSNGYGLCNCKDFQSSDNLEYLERRYEEKNNKTS